MGNEALCQAEFSGQPQTGKALLETTELIFRPNDGSKPVKIPFSTIKSAKAQNGELQLRTAIGPIRFTLGPTAEKWCHKILHPKTRSEKLGLKPGVNVSLLGSFDQEFLKELRDTKASLHKGKINAASDLIFLSHQLHKAPDVCSQQSSEIDQRLDRPLDRLPKRKKRNHRERCPIHRPRVRPERRKGRRLLRNPHRPEIRPPTRSTLASDDLGRRTDTCNGRSSSHDFNCGYHPNVSDLLEVRGLNVELPTPAGWIRPVNDVSLRIDAGESLGLVGESGSGKTMMALALMGLLPVGARVSGEAILSGDIKLPGRTNSIWRTTSYRQCVQLPAMQPVVVQTRRERTLPT